MACMGGIQRGHVGFNSIHCYIPSSIRIRHYRSVRASGTFLCCDNKSALNLTFVRLRHDTMKCATTHTHTHTHAFPGPVFYM